MAKVILAKDRASEQRRAVKVGRGENVSERDDMDFKLGMLTT